MKTLKVYIIVCKVYFLLNFSVVEKDCHKLTLMNQMDSSDHPLSHLNKDSAII